jgi:hypothetical protein
VSRELRQSKSNAVTKAVSSTVRSEDINQLNGSDGDEDRSDNPPTSGGGGWLKNLPFRR